MKTYYCDWCDSEYTFEKYQQWGAHRSTCKENPNREQNLQNNKKARNKPEVNTKIRKALTKPRITFTQECIKCGNEFESTITQNSYNKGVYSKHCSRSCANSRTHSKETKEKIKKSINEYNKANLKPKKCKYCNEELPIATRKVTCSDCKQWHLNITLFKKLQVYEPDTKLSIISNRALEKLKDLYFNQQFSLIDIYEKYNIRYNTTTFFFDKHNISLRNLSESQCLSIKKGRVMPTSPYPYKSFYHTSWNGTDVYLRSSYELDLAEQLDEQKIHYEVETIRIEYYDTQKEKTRIAVPDFHIPDENKIIEVKSDYTFDKQRMEDKVKAYKEKGYTFELYLEKELVDFDMIK